MIGRRHVCLLVEDDPTSAAAFEELLGMLGYDCIRGSSLVEGRRLGAAGGFCCVLMDLQILPSRESMKPEIEAGLALLEDLRGMYPKTNESGHHSLQIVVMSGHAREHHYVRQAWSKGADDFLYKPLEDNRISLADTIRNCLTRSGRHDHARCAAVLREAARDRTTEGRTASGAPALRLRITGRSANGRTEIEVNGRRLTLTNGVFTVLFGLVAGRLRGVEWVHKHELGAREGEGYKGISLLALEIRPHLAEEMKLTINNRGGGYRLHEAVEIEEIDVAALTAHPMARVRQLVAGLVREGRLSVKEGKEEDPPEEKRHSGKQRVGERGREETRGGARGRDKDKGRERERARLKQG